MLPLDKLKNIKEKTIGSCQRCNGQAFVPAEGLLVPCACSIEFDRQVRYCEANIPPKYLSLNFKDFKDNKQSGYTQIMDYVEHITTALEKGVGMYILGSEGSGKTLLGVSILKVVLEKNGSGYFNTLENLMGMIKSNFENAEAYNSIETMVRECDLLVLDRVGKTSQYNIEHLEPILISRDEYNKATIFTSDISVADVERVLSKGIHQYCVERMLPVVITGGNYRKENIAKKLWDEVRGV